MRRSTPTIAEIRPSFENVKAQRDVGRRPWFVRTRPGCQHCLHGQPIAYNATVVRRTDLADALATFLIQPDQPPRRRPWFIAGQYCVLGLNNSEKPELGSVRRAMSIASAPEIGRSARVLHPIRRQAVVSKPSDASAVEAHRR
jgi:hypothetical protein